MENIIDLKNIIKVFRVKSQDIIVLKGLDVQIKKGEFVKAKIPVVQTSYLHPEGEIFEISSDGNTSNPGMLTNQGEFANNKIENLLPLDYQLGD